MTQVAETKEYGVDARLRALWSDDWTKAPRDGSEVLLRLHDGGIHRGHWSTNYSVFGLGGCWTDGFSTMGDKIDYSHWAPGDKLDELLWLLGKHASTLERRASDKPSEAVAWIDPEALVRMRERNGWTTVLIRPRCEEDCTLPLFTSSVTVKPLAFDPPLKSSDRYAHSVVGQYGVGRIGAAYSVILRAVRDGQDDDEVIARNLPDEEAAIAVANTHYQSAILSTLTTQPAESAKSGDGERERFPKTIGKIEQAIDQYVDDLLARKHGGIAMANAFSAVCEALGRNPVAEMDRRAAALRDHRND